MHIVAIVVLALAIVSAAGGLASLGGRVSQTLDISAHFVPVWAVMGAVAALAALGLGELGHTAMWMGLVAVAASALLIAPELLARRRLGRAAFAEGVSVRIVQFNLWRWNLDPEGSAAWLASETADVVVVQEVIDNAAAIPEALSKSYPHQTHLRTGTRILSRLPILDHGAYRARSTRTHSTGAWVRLDHPAGPFEVFGIQSTWPIPPGRQQRDSVDLARQLDRFDRRTLIVCGDFNATPWSESLRRQDRLFAIQRRSRALLTWPVQPYTQLKLSSPLPFLALDHIYAGPAWKTVEVRVGPRLGSDHLPVIAVLSR
ncbi:MAG TPA: endonuclease/exonuclease/phosphatase family protein [Caulobacteraceae bacterium]|jgi:endonuclease/exonuclease/phosphatase (EEP) superfamily protein YafD